MDNIVNCIMMAGMCCLAAININIYVDEKKKPDYNNGFAWLNLAAAFVCILTAFRFALR